MEDAGIVDSGLRVDVGALDSATARDAGARDANSADADSGVDSSLPFEEVNFIALGDTGEGNEAQHAVGDQIASFCLSHPCDFAILLGDNIYNSGVSSVDDPQWQSKFEGPYANVNLPFYAVLGNHDYGGTVGLRQIGGLGNEFEKGPIEVSYSQLSSKWRMPWTHYAFRVGSVGFVVLDTNSLFWNHSQFGDQAAFVRESMASLRAEGAQYFVFAGHHPYRSNGPHGNVGDYEAVEFAGLRFPSEFYRGTYLKAFFDETVCGLADMYICGHDHDLQWINEPTQFCGAQMIVSGAGSKVTNFARTSNQTHFANDQTPGFSYISIRQNELQIRFIDRGGAVLFEALVDRASMLP